MPATSRRARSRASRSARRADPGLLGAAVLLVVGSYVALSVDVVQTGFGIKGDEATYVAMALSAAYDGDLAYEAEDIERFYELYNHGPEGIFLKRGADAVYRFDEGFPYIVRDTVPDDDPNRLYFGKAYIYSVAAAPFVRVAGLNGLLLFHVVLLSLVVLLGYRFVAARSPGGVAAVYAVGFFGASIVPLYAVWLTSEVFNVACVFSAYFLWFYKEVAPPSDTRVGRFVRGPWSDVAAAVLLGVAAYSKPPHVLLIIPPVVWAWWRQQWRWGFTIGVVCALVTAGGFVLNAGITGEFNYQGGDRKTFYGHFPFERPGDDFDELGIGMTTNQVVIEEPLGLGGFLELLGTNLGYFLVGRHFGFVPFFFPGVVAIALFLWPRSSRYVWQWATLGTVAACAVALVIYMPYTWSGGGGPSGNRYFLSIYPALFFVTPPLASVAPAVVAWLGGAMFTAHILINPFVSAKRPYLSVERGALRALPVELTMINDLPIALNGPRNRIRYGENPPLLLYYLDHNAYLPEGPGVWVEGGQRADLIVRSRDRLERVDVILRTPIDNTVWVELDGDARTVEIEGGQPQSVSFSPDGVYARRSWAYLLSVHPEEGFVPRLTRSDSRDGRHLGVAVSLEATVTSSGARAASGR